MATKLRNMGVNGIASLPRYAKSALVSPNGHLPVMVVADTNDAGTTATYGDQTAVSKLYFYEATNGAMDAWTLRLTVSLASALAKFVVYSAEVYANGDIGVAYKLANGNVAYRKITIATWTAAAEETVRANAAGTTITALDLSISPADIPIVGVMRGSTTAGQESTVEVYVKRTSDSTWQRPVQTVTLTGTYSAYNWDISIAAIPEVGSATNRGVAVITSQGNSSGNDGDAQLRTFSFREDTGAIVNAPTLRVTLDPDSVTGSNTQPGPPRRVFVNPLQFGGQGAIMVGVMSARTGAANQPGVTKMIAAQYRHDPVANNWVEMIPPATKSGPTDVTPGGGMAMWATYDRIAFMFSSKFIGGTSKQAAIHTVLANLDDSQKVVSWTTPHVWTDSLNNTYGEIMPYTWSKNNNSTKSLVVAYLYYKSATAFELWVEPRREAKTTSLAIPANGSTVNTSTPAVAADVDWDRKYPQYPNALTFEFAKDAGFTTGYVSYYQPDSKFVDVIGTDVAGVVMRINDVLPLASLLTQGLWYAKVGVHTPFGSNNAPIITTSFTVSHPPTPANIAPKFDQFLIYGAGNVTFSWEFTDSSPEDYQTAYQIIVERISDGATVLDTGKVLSQPLRQHTNAIAAGYKDTQLRWKIRLWDRDDVAGAYSGYETFYIVDPPTLAVTSPTVDQVLTTGAPTITANVTIGASRTLKNYTFTIWQGSAAIWTSGPLTNQAGLNGVVPISVTVPSGLLRNTNAYTLEVKATDSVNLNTSSVQVPFSTAWVLPAAVTVVTASATSYNVEGAGYVTITWADAAKDVDFEFWTVYRRANETDNAGAVIEVGSWVAVGTSYESIGATHTLLDLNAPSGGKVEYKVTQTVNRFGDLVEGPDSNIPSVNPVTDGYWLLATDGTNAFQLTIVTGDSYTDEYEEEEFIIAGRGRHVDRGEHLGLKGTLSVRLRDTGGTTARQKKRRLETMKENNVVLYLRTPFGDVYRVSASNLGVSRLAGVGRSEFVDVEIPYTEVGE